MDRGDNPTHQVVQQAIVNSSLRFHGRTPIISLPQEPLATTLLDERRAKRPARSTGSLLPTVEGGRHQHALAL
jgi:hypothetical protein